MASDDAGSVLKCHGAGGRKSEVHCGRPPPLVAASRRANSRDSESQTDEAAERKRLSGGGRHGSSVAPPLDIS